MAEIICHSQNTVCEYDCSVETLVVECHFSRLCLLNEYLCRSAYSLEILNVESCRWDENTMSVGENRWKDADVIIT